MDFNNYKIKFLLHNSTLDEMGKSIRSLELLEFKI
jgi:hypothetical protein